MVSRSSYPLWAVLGVLLGLLIMVSAETQGPLHPTSGPVQPPTNITEPSPTKSDASLKEDSIKTGQEEEKQVNMVKETKPLSRPSTVYPSSTFDAYKVSKSSIGIIVAVKDYGVRQLPLLFSQMGKLKGDGESAGLQLDIVFVHVGSASLVQHDILYQAAEPWKDQIHYLGPKRRNEFVNYGEALNMGANHFKSSDYLLFLTDAIHNLSIASIIAMNKVLMHPDVGIVGPKILDASQAEKTVWSAGIDLFLGRNPHKSAWTTWSTDPSYHESLVTAVSDVPYLLHRYQGHLNQDKRVNLIEAVWAVSKSCLMIKTDLFIQATRFQPSFQVGYLDVDLSLRIWRDFGKATVYNPMITVSVAETNSPNGQSSISSFNNNNNNNNDNHNNNPLVDDNLADISYGANDDPIAKDNKRFLETWLEPLLPLLKVQSDIVVNDLPLSTGLDNLTVVWNMDCGTGQVLGFTTETVNLLMELHRHVRVKVTNDGAVCSSELKKAGFPAYTRNIIDILSKREEISVSTDSQVVVMHKDPGRYDHTYAYSPPDLLIGRSMYETNSIPSDWLENIKMVDYVWVPSTFNLQTFAQAGVNVSKLVVIPETIDMMHFDPDITEGMHKEEIQKLASQYKWGHSAEQFIDPTAFNFLAVFKWEARKAWDTLITAFFDEFSSEEDVKTVSLYIRSNMAHENVVEFQTLVSNYCASKGNLKVEQLPRVVFLDSFISYSKLPFMFKGAQALVSATHGEGWGLPIMEAMSMSLPVILTNWSGSTEFTSNTTAYLIAVDELSPAPQSGHQWAVINPVELRRQMRNVVQQPEQAKATGILARKHLLANFSQREVTKRILNQIVTLRPRFAEIKAARPPPSYSYRAKYNPPVTIPFSWNTAATVTKHGKKLTKSKMTDL